MNTQHKPPPMYAVRRTESRPQPGPGNGLLPKLRRHFEETQGVEQLTAKELAARFGYPVRTVSTVLCTLKAEGVAEEATVWRYKPAEPSV